MGDFTQKLAHVCNACEKIMLAAQMSLQTTERKTRVTNVRQLV